MNFENYLKKGLPEPEAHYLADKDALDSLIARYKRQEFDLLWFDAWNETTMKRLADYAYQTSPNIPIEFSYINRG